MTGRLRIVAGCLGAILLSLLGIGWVSDTLLRCGIQGVPVALALVAISTGYPWGSSATIPIFSFWLILVGNALIVGRVQHPPSTPELVLTCLIGVFSLIGMGASLGNSKGSGRFIRIAMGIMWFFLQLAAQFASGRATH